jgi:serine/threonine protein kinase
MAMAEIKILLKLDHRNIIKYYYFEEDESFINIAIEKC